MLGKTFTREALAALSRHRRGRARAGARRRSCARRCSSIQADPRSPEHGQYGFLQDLCARSPTRRSRSATGATRHLAAAAYLERALRRRRRDRRGAGVALPRRLRRRRPTRPTAPSVRRRAASCSSAPGERAESLGAADRGAALLHPGRRADARRRWTRPACSTGRRRWPCARRRRTRPPSSAERAQALYEAAGEHGAAARVLVVGRRIDQAQGRLDEALERMQRAYDVLRDEPPDESFATLTTRLAGAYYFSGDVAALRRAGRGGARHRRGARHADGAHERDA